MMTALVAMERASLVTPITATERSLSEPVIIGLDPGDSLPLEEMLYGMLLPSGNDAALAVAESVGGGSIDRFVGWMNERAVSMGLRNTHFMNPTGLDAAGHYSSARDMAEIAWGVLNDPTLARIVATPRYVVQGPPLYLFLNNNPLLGAYEGANGVKTGFTDDAGRTFAASAERNGQKLIAILLNSADLRTVGSGLLDLGFALPGVTVDVVRPGFARVQLNGGDQRGASTRLAGWEAPFLRAMMINTGQGMQVRLLLAGRPLLRWTQ
jgi:D-alanyl-D-alanine carboxypeptidase